MNYFNEFDLLRDDIVSIFYVFRAKIYFILYFEVDMGR